MMITTNKFIIWLWLPIALILAIAEAFWVEIKRIFTDSLFWPKLKENFKYLKEVYFG